MTFTAPEGGVTSGTPLIIEDIFCVPLSTVAGGGTFAAAVTGIVGPIAKATGFAPAAGDAAYWNDTSHHVTDATDDILIGVFARAAGSSDTTCYVRLNGTCTRGADGNGNGDVVAIATTGFVSCTGVLNGSSEPTTFYFPIMPLGEGFSILQCFLCAPLADLQGMDISAADYSLVFIGEGWSVSYIYTLDNPTEPLNLIELSPPYEIPGNGYVALEISGLPAESTVIVKGDIVFTAPTPSP